MKRSDVIEIISTASVVIGLVFVGIQLHQNTTVQRITATQTLSASYSDALEVLGFESLVGALAALSMGSKRVEAQEVRKGFAAVTVSDLPASEEWYAC